MRTAFHRACPSCHSPCAQAHCMATVCRNIQFFEMVDAAFFLRHKCAHARAHACISAAACVRRIATGDALPDFGLSRQMWLRSRADVSGVLSRCGRLRPRAPKPSQLPEAGPFGLGALMGERPGLFVCLPQRAPHSRGLCGGRDRSARARAWLALVPHRVRHGRRNPFLPAGLTHLRVRTRPPLHRDWAHPEHICTGNWARPCVALLVVFIRRPLHSRIRMGARWRRKTACCSPSSAVVRSSAKAPS